MLPMASDLARFCDHDNEPSGSVESGEFCNGIQLFGFGCLVGGYWKGAERKWARKLQLFANETN